MADYSIETCRELEEKFFEARLHRPMRITRYEVGTELEYEVTAVAGSAESLTAWVRLAIEKFAGGGFAGQVYRIKVLEVSKGSIAGIEPGGIYAMKILVPPSGFALMFRNLVYAIGFQGPFQLQCNPAAARSGAIWQKFIRRGARVRFGDERAVNDIHGTFLDGNLGSCGELSDWVDGRTWRLEVDDKMDLLTRWKKGESIPQDRLGSPEYRAKKIFMAGFVQLLHDMGAHEFARQYEWSTCKSQPNCLKRREADEDPASGLTAVDFRAGLALLPFLPMSPGDFKLIGRGIRRGSLVQFDRGDLGRLEAFADKHPDAFEDLRESLGELKEVEQLYRQSVPDITHNHLKLLYSRSLWSTLLKSAVSGWKVRNIVDRRGEKRLSGSLLLTVLFFLAGAIPLAGRIARRALGHAAWRKHYVAMLKSGDYFRRGLHGRMAEMLVGWHRAGRVAGPDALKTAGAPGRFLLHFCLSILPVGLHKILISWPYFKQRLAYFLVRPVRLYFNAELREQWLRDMITEGRNKQIISEEDAGGILSQIKEPFIQKYLKSLAVHVCTLPVTQIVSVGAAILYVLLHPEMPRAQSWGIGLGIIALFQVVPVSPGSLVRGLYVLYLVIRERNFKDYNIAVFLGFFKYIGYLAFPIQMAYRYPALARFMAAHWATNAVPIVPVFGESGALLEHEVFCWCYNWPLTLRRRMRKRAELRAATPPRYRHVFLCALSAAGFLAASEIWYYFVTGALPGLKDMWLLMVLPPLLCGVWVTLGCGGAAFARRVTATVSCGLLAALLYTGATGLIGAAAGVDGSGLVLTGVWRAFIFMIFAPIGAILTELKLPDPDI